MDNIKHNLDKELKFIDLFGYNLVGPNGSNRWTILDGNNKEKIYKIDNIHHVIQ